MFSGLIESTGEVAGVQVIPAGVRLRIDTALAPELEHGDSIAVNGVCLTVVRRNNLAFDAEVSPETARVTTLGQLSRETVVNLERPLRVDARVGGHFVLGHVDGVGNVSEIRQQSDFYLVTVRYNPDLAPYIICKGSITVDGISLTVAHLRQEAFDVQIVPYTWQHTNLRASHAEAPVNLECDIIGKYVVKAVRDTA